MSEKRARRRFSAEQNSRCAASAFRKHLSARAMSGAKLRGSAGLEASAALALDLLGPDGIASATADCEWRTLFLTSPSMSIRGGTDEIQRNILGGRVLDLPPESGADGDVPFWQLPRTAR